MIDVQLSFVSSEVLQEKAKSLSSDLKSLTESLLIPGMDLFELETAIEKTKTELDTVIDEILKRREKRQDS